MLDLYAWIQSVMSSIEASFHREKLEAIVCVLDDFIFKLFYCQIVTFPKMIISFPEEEMKLVF